MSHRDVAGLARLDRQVAELREGAKEAKRVLAGVVRERDRLSGELIAVRHGSTVARLPTGGSMAERLLEAAVGALRARPPAGVEVAYIDGFIARSRGTLLGIVRGAFPG